MIRLGAYHCVRGSSRKVVVWTHPVCNVADVTFYGKTMTIKPCDDTAPLRMEAGTREPLRSGVLGFARQQGLRLE